MSKGERILILEQQVRNLIAEQQGTRDAMEKLAVVQNLEWSQDAKAWVSKEKLKALRDEPR